MSVTVRLRNLRYSPRKLVAITSLFAKQPLAASMNKSFLMKNKSALYVYKLLKMAESAAKDKSLNLDNLIIKEIYANEGARMKRARATGRGHSSPYVKQLSHLTITLDEAVEKPKTNTKKGTNGTKS